MDGEILAIKERVKDLEERVDKNQAQIEELQKGQSEFSKDVHEIKIHSQYTRQSLDEIKESISKLEQYRLEEHFEKPLRLRMTREEKIMGMIIAGLTLLILSILFPMVNW